MSVVVLVCTKPFGLNISNIFLYHIVIFLSNLNSLGDALKELDEDMDTDVSLTDSEEDEMYYRSVD